ncbi:hypothetical protein SO802_013950 [Lithocarpus litseifolius]|uniref:Disease resistance N-terminal domain-containing protein n=1 Tax=Lithocarpus litseifolius TaxID=425828 RepID=A0AAW2D7X8_9ROSI
MELQFNSNGSLIPSLESSILRLEYGFQDWVFGFANFPFPSYGWCSTFCYCEAARSFHFFRVRVDKEVQKLETKFRTIQAVLNDAEKRQLKEVAKAIVEALGVRDFNTTELQSLGPGCTPSC